MWFLALLYSLAALIGVVVFRKSNSRRVRQAVLLVLSYALYTTWGAWFAIVLFASTAVNYGCGQWLRRKRSSAVLWSSIGFNVALLASFKYLPEIASSTSIAALQKFSTILLPLGISFWTFQAMGYLFDLYGGEDLNPSFVEFALYMAFFPVAISGPICRMPDMLPQFRSQAPVGRDDLRRGLGRIATGALMMLLAQLLGKGIPGGVGINGAYDQVARWSGPDVWCMAFGYGLRLFLDFAGYSHIAIGAARMLGFTVPENFARPYASTSPSMFWTRQHMSLSFWIRDYVYIPMAMLRREEWWPKLCLLLSMVLFGVWHKGTILFVLFGCYHGTLLVLHRQWQELQRKFGWKLPASIWTPLSWITTLAVVSLGWIFFRANSLQQARAMLASLLSPASYGNHFLPWSLYLLVMTLAAGYAMVLLVIDALDRYSAEAAMAASSSRAEVLATLARDRWTWIAPLYVAASLMAVMIMRGQSSGPGPFMYRNF
jgi:alginate O-acetyltransferase complex protein AlgI